MRDKATPLAHLLEQALTLPISGPHEPYHYMTANDFNLKGANLEGLTLENIELHDLCFDNASLVGAKCRNCNFSRCTFRNANLSNTEFYHCFFPNVNFEGATLNEASFRDSNLQNARFDGATYLKIMLEGAHLRGTIFDEKHVLIRPYEITAAGSPEGLVGNPFTPDPGRVPYYLGGRDEAKETLLDGLNITIQGGVAHALVVGNHAIGKTALLKWFERETKERGIWTSFISLYSFPETNTITDTAISFISMLNEGFGEDIRTMKKHLQKVTGIGVHFLESGINVDRESGHLDEVVLLSSTISRIWKESKNKTSCIVIIIDDVHEISPFVAFLKWLRSAQISLKNRVPILFVLASTPQKWEAERKDRYTPPFRDYQSRRINLRELTIDESRMIIRETLRPTRVHFTEDIIEAAVSYAEGNPYDLQLICENLFALQRGSKVTIDEWEIAYKKAGAK